MAEINPAVGVLVPEQRTKLHIALAPVRAPGVTAGPAAPGRNGQRVSGGTKTEDVQDHPFVIADPIAESAETCGGLPAHSNDIRSLGHEGPVHAIKNSVGHRPNGSFTRAGAVEVLFGV